MFIEKFNYIFKIYVILAVWFCPEILTQTDFQKWKEFIAPIRKIVLVLVYKVVYRRVIMFCFKQTDHLIGGVDQAKEISKGINNATLFLPVIY